MKSFEYKITDEVGIHARPAGLAAKKAREFQSDITIEKDGKTANLKKLIATMELCVHCGDNVRITASGSDEELAIVEMKSFFEKNL